MAFFSFSKHEDAHGSNSRVMRVVSRAVTFPERVFNVSKDLASIKRNEIGVAVADFFGGMVHKPKDEEEDNVSEHLDSGFVVFTKMAPQSHRNSSLDTPSIVALSAAKQMTGWLEAGTIIKIEKTTPELNQEVYRNALPTVYFRVTLRENGFYSGNPGKDTQNGSPTKSSRSIVGGFIGMLTDLLPSSQTQEVPSMVNKGLIHLRQIVQTELKNLKDTEPDKTFLAALKDFEKDIQAPAIEPQLADGGVSSLVGIFESALKKQMDKELQFKLSASGTIESSGPFQQRVKRFLSILNEVRQKIDEISKPMIQTETSTLAMHLRKALSISDEDHSDAVSNLTNITRKEVFNEFLRRFLLLDQNAYYNPTNFGSRDTFEIWKSYERKDLMEIMKKVDETTFILWEKEEQTKLKKSDQPRRILVKVVEARNLAAKDKKTGASDPYVMVEYGKESFQTSIKQNTINPVWNEQIILNVKDMTIPITLTIWDKDDEHKINIFSTKFLRDEVDDFLGMLKFDVHQIVNKQDPWEDWFDVQPRSKRSNVRGQVHLLLMILPPESKPSNSDTIRQQPTVEVDYHARYMYLMRELFRADSEGLTTMPNLSPESTIVLNEFACRYRVGLVFQRVAYLAYLVEAHQQVDVDTDVLISGITGVSELVKTKYPFTADERSAAGRSLEILFEFTLVQVSKYDECFLKKDSKTLSDSIAILSIIYENQIFQERRSNTNTVTLKQLLVDRLKGAAEERFRRIAEESSPEINNPALHLTRLIEMIHEQLDYDVVRFQRPFGISVVPIDIVTIDSLVLIRHLLEAVDLYSKHFSSNEDKIKEFLQVYRKMKAFKEEHVDIPSPQEEFEAFERLKKDFVLEPIFYPFVKSFLNVMHHMILMWARNALQLDTFVPIDDAKHSVSVVDTFTTFFAALDSLQELEWPDKAEKAEFFSDYALTLSTVIQDYAQTLLEQIKDTYRKLTEVVDNSHKTGFFKFGSKMNVSPIEVTKQSCVKVNNLEAIRNNLRTLREQVDKQLGVTSLEETLSPSTIQRPSSPPPVEQQQIESLTAVIKLEILSGNGLRACDATGKSDPYVIVYAVNKQEVTPRKYSLLGGKLDTKTGGGYLYQKIAHNLKHDPSANKVARTRVINQNLNPVWEEQFEFSVKEAVSLQFIVMDYDSFGKGDVCGQVEVNLLLSNITDGHLHSFDLELDPQGILKVRLQTILSQHADADYHFVFAFRAIKRYVSDMLDVFVNAMRPFFRECFRKMIDSSRPKTANMFTGKSDHPVQDSEVQNALAPLFGYLDANLSTLADQLYPETRDIMLWKTWKAIIDELKIVLVPTLESDANADRSVFKHRSSILISKREHHFVMMAADSVRTFFYADGKGLSEKNLDGSKYKALRFLLDKYFAETDVLIDEYKILTKQASRPHSSVSEAVDRERNDKDSIAQEQKQAILQLLHMREDKKAQQFVEDMQQHAVHEKRWANEKK